MNLDGTPLVEDEKDSGKNNHPETVTVKADTTVTVSNTNELQCSECGFVAKTKAGLSVHKTKH